ncbi:hypothetical protein [Actinomadura sp. BRA 177]|uniref:hypothetical protein n=1 Tax=Actinomadura sp. BRA 177 TaxID=2745202 RepID=UPI001595F905|nr:hypothetical protein [Actinomadura sp. BRA 177]NVI86648.1 hypothetical protein [Actinomadura sp. BRA 177]
MSPKPLEQVTLADLATKDDLKNLVTKDYLHQELNSLKQELRQEFRGEMGSLKEELRGEIGSAKRELRGELGSAVNLIMGELGKMSARQEEMAGTLARLVAKSEGVMQ